MIATNDFDSQILTISKNGMAKRSRIGSSEKLPDLNENGEQKMVKNKDGVLVPKIKVDGYTRTKPGAMGVLTMKLNEQHGDQLVSVRQIPDLGDNLFVLTKKGMMIRLEVNQTKETFTKSTRGTRIMELRSKDRQSFVDEIIFTARLPADLVETSKSEHDMDANSKSSDDDSQLTSGEEE